MRLSRRKGYSEKRGGSELKLKGTPTSDGRCDCRGREKTEREQQNHKSVVSQNRERVCQKSQWWFVSSKTLSTFYSTFSFLLYIPFHIYIMAICVHIILPPLQCRILKGRGCALFIFVSTTNSAEYWLCSMLNNYLLKEWMNCGMVSHSKFSQRTFVASSDVNGSLGSEVLEMHHIAPYWEDLR